MFGVFSFAAGGSALLLPETLGHPLLDTIEQIDDRRESPLNAVLPSTDLACLIKAPNTRVIYKMHNYEPIQLLKAIPLYVSNIDEGYKRHEVHS